MVMSAMAGQRGVPGILMNFRIVSIFTVCVTRIFQVVSLFKCTYTGTTTYFDMLTHTYTHLGRNQPIYSLWICGAFLGIGEDGGEGADLPEAAESMGDESRETVSIMCYGI